jgi:hypothetical protein
MKDNFELRRDLVNTLGSKSGADLSGQIAGYTMRSPIPVGLAGTGPAIAAEVALAKYVDPHFWPMIAASSPRVAAEFLKVFGKAMSETQMARPVLSPAISNVAAKTILAPTAAAPAPVPQEPAPKTRSSRKYGKKGNEDDLNAL